MIVNEIEVKDVKTYEVELREFMRVRYGELMERIVQTGVLTDEDTELMKQALGEFTKKFRLEVYHASAE